nr:porin [uncultured Roseateles sp.]
MKTSKFLGTALCLAVGVVGAVAAQPSAVTIAGKIDLGVGRNIGATRTGVQDAAGSRLSLRGDEDLGGGLRALFALEHRFSPDTGMQTDATRFWQGYATVGLRHAWGSIHLGHQYTAAYSLAQNVIDPWGGDTVAQLRTAWRGGVARTRVSDSIRYDYGADGVNVAASLGEAVVDGAGAGPDRPFSIAANYAVGALLVAAGWEDPAHAEDHLFSLGATYRIGGTTLAAGWSRGRTTRSDHFRSILLAVNHRVGVGSLRAGMVTATTRTAAGTTRAETRKLGLGYFHPLSKRTFLYVNVAHDRKVEVMPFGFDLGMQHNF